MLALRNFAAGCRRAVERRLLHMVSHVRMALLQSTSETVWRSLTLSRSTSLRSLAWHTLMPPQLLAPAARGNLADAQGFDRLWDAASPTSAALVRDLRVRACVADSSASGKAERPG
jgi:hypothetical protein